MKRLVGQIAALISALAVGQPTTARINNPPSLCAYPALSRLSDDANAAIRAGDLRPMSIGSTWGDDEYPGIVCPHGDYSRLVSRGGIYHSDVVASCPAKSDSASAVPSLEGTVKAFNERLAATKAFQSATGCRSDRWMTAHHHTLHAGSRKHISRTQPVRA